MLWKEFRGVRIWGGKINNTVIGAIRQAAGYFTSITVSKANTAGIKVDKKI